MPLSSEGSSGRLQVLATLPFSFEIGVRTGSGSALENEGDLMQDHVSQLSRRVGAAHRVSYDLPREDRPDAGQSGGLTSLRHPTAQDMGQGFHGQFDEHEWLGYQIGAPAQARFGAAFKIREACYEDNRSSFVAGQIPYARA